MKKLLFPLALILLAACGQKGQEAKETQKQTRPEAPLAEMEFPEGIDHNFGNYYEKVVKTYDFLVHNPGKTPLVINQVETFCSCTQASFPTKPILEGETDTIHVSFDGNGFVEGVWTKQIRVHANIEGGTKDLWIRGAYYNNNGQ